MGSYRVEFKPGVEKDLQKLPKRVVVRVVKRIESLAADPRPHQTTKLSGAERLYRLRVGDYRIIYEVETETKRVLVHFVRHRREAYRQLP